MGISQLPPEERPQNLELKDRKDIRGDELPEDWVARILGPRRYRYYAKGT